MKKVLFLLPFLMAVVAPDSYGPIVPHPSVGTAMTSLEPSAGGCSGGTCTSDANCASGTDCETLMVSAAGRWKAADAQCSGVTGDCADTEDVETLPGWNSGDDFTQSTASAKPTWDADCGGSASFGCLSFDGSTDLMEIASSGALFDSFTTGTNATWSMLVVYLPGAVDASDAAVIGKWNNTGSLRSWAYRKSRAGGCNGETFQWSGNGSSTTEFACHSDGTTNFSDASNTKDVKSIFMNIDMTNAANEDGVDARINRYGDDYALTGSAGNDTRIADTTATVRLGNMQSETEYTTMHLVEVIIWDDTRSAAEITTLNTYLKDTYGIVRPPPGYLMDIRADQAACAGTQGDCTDNADIETWHDLGSSGTNFVNAAGTDRPTWQQASDCGDSGRPCVRFDGVNDNMDAGDVELGMSGTDSEFALVVVSTAAGTSGTPIGKFDGATPSWFFQSHTTAYTASNFQIYYSAVDWDAFTSPYTSINSDSHFYFINYDGSVDTGAGVDRFDWDADRFDTTVTNSNGGGTLGDIANTTSPLCVGDVDCTVGTPYSPFAGDIWEALIYENRLTAAQITGLEEYMKTRYNNIRPPAGYAVWLDGQDIDGDGTYNSGYSDGQTLVAALGGKGSKANTYTVAGDPIIDKTCDVLTGADCIVFDGTTDNLTSSDQAQSIDPPIACYVATLSTGTNSNYYLMFWAAQTAGTDGFVFGADTTSNGWKLFNGSTLTATETATPGNLYMVTIESDSTAQFRVNAAATDISGNPGTRNIGESDMAKIRTGQTFETSIVEALFYDQDVADPGLTNCETYFQERYGTSFWSP